MTPTDLKDCSDFSNDFLAWAQAEMKAGKGVDVAAGEYSIPDKYKSKGYTAVLPTPTSPTAFARTYPQGVGVKANLQIIYDEMKR